MRLFVSGIHQKAEREKLHLTINQKCAAPIIDLFNNEVISCSISERPTMPMIDDILMKAFARLDAGTNPVLHSDQGWQYRHQWYQYQLREFGIIQSMSRKGNGLDNACAEFFSGL
ncbi:transposase family protein [Salmonella enterica subsp. arizonae]|nr:transposase family protein [Salmonella enterica subsp. arizonae]